jgi:hypothetical protein
MHREHAVLILIGRTSGVVRCFHIGKADAAHIVPIVERETAIATDEARVRRRLRLSFHCSIKCAEDPPYEHLIEQYALDMPSICTIKCA